jgi:hemerythrin
MGLFVWRESYSVNIKSIDAQHHKLVDLINDLHDGMKQGKGKEVLGGVLSELVSYTALHFSTEEKYFDKYGYPDTLVHKRQHKDLVDQVLQFKKSFEAGNSIITIEILNFLRDWLLEHIAGSDKKYMVFLNSKGVF